MPPGIGYGKRAPIKQRQSPYSAVVDTSGMDPEMKATLGGMRGPGGSAGASDPFGGLKKFVGGLMKKKAKK